MNKKTSIIITAALAVFTTFALCAASISTGTLLQNVQVRDTRNKPAWIPEFGKKVLIILYNDVDVTDQNDLFATLIQKAKIPEEKKLPIGIANMKDAPWKPDSVIRYMARRKIKQYPGTVILTDPEYILRDAWGLGNCNQKSVVIIIGTDKKVHFYKKGKMNESEAQQGLEIIRKLVQ